MRAPLRAPCSAPTISRVFSAASVGKVCRSCRDFSRGKRGLTRALACDRGCLEPHRSIEARDHRVFSKNDTRHAPIRDPRKFRSRRTRVRTRLWRGATGGLLRSCAPWPPLAVASPRGAPSERCVRLRRRGPRPASNDRISANSNPIWTIERVQTRLVDGLRRLSRTLSIVLYHPTPVYTPLSKTNFKSQI